MSIYADNINNFRGKVLIPLTSVASVHGWSGAPAGGPGGRVHVVHHTVHDGLRRAVVVHHWALDLVLAGSVLGQTSEGSELQKRTKTFNVC